MSNNDIQDLKSRNKYGMTATIHLDRLRKNIQTVQKHIPSDCQIFAVIKSDGYGHGAIEIAKELIRNQIESLAVLDLDEAIALRKGNIRADILILSDVPKEFAREIIAYNLTVSVSSIDFAKELSLEAIKQRRKVAIHIKVDTGMGRFGMLPEQAPFIISKIKRFPGIYVEGIFSHLSSTFTDDVESNEYTLNQINDFNSLLDKLKILKLLPQIVHLGSSTSLIGFSEKVVGDFYNGIRIGTLFYGFEERKSDWPEHPTPICDLQTRILTLRNIPKGAYVSYDRIYRAPSDLYVGILPVGYSHGLHRDLSNQGTVIVNKVTCPIIGKITIGNTMINLTDVEHVTEGTTIELIGKLNSAFNIGQKIHRGTWEILLPLLQRCNSKKYIR